MLSLHGHAVQDKRRLPMDTGDICYHGLIFAQLSQVVSHPALSCPISSEGFAQQHSTEMNSRDVQTLGFSLSIILLLSFSEMSEK